MNVIAIDTATETLGISLQTREGKTSSVSMKMGYKHGELLAPWIVTLLDTASIRSSDLDLVICASGPGSFTGLRIGIATAKGLSLGAGCPLVMVSTLDAIAFGFQFFRGVILPVFDAKKHRYYTAKYKEGNRLTDYLDIPLEEMKTLVSLDDEVLVSGPGANDAYETLRGQSGTVRVQMDPLFERHNPALLLCLGMKRFAENPSGSKDTDGPLYVRKSEAEIGINTKHVQAR